MRCHLAVDGHGALIDTELRKALERLEGAARRLRRVCEWADCTSEPTDAQVDRWLREMNSLLNKVENIRGLRLI